MILVGDSLGMVVQGEPHTIPVDLEEMEYHVRTVARAATRGARRRRPAVRLVPGEPAAGRGELDPADEGRRRLRQARGRRRDGRDDRRHRPRRHPRRRPHRPDAAELPPHGRPQGPGTAHRQRGRRPRPADRGRLRRRAGRRLRRRHRGRPALARRRDHRQAVDPDDRHRRRARLRRPGARAARRARAVRPAAQVHQAVRRPAQPRRSTPPPTTSPTCAAASGPTTSTPSTDADGAARHTRTRCAPGRPVARRPAARSASCRRWAPCTTGTCRSSTIARQRCDDVVVSIFVNPLQFDRADDFDAYPRPIDDDVARCADVGVDAVYAPTAAAMYPPGFETARRARTRSPT